MEAKINGNGNNYSNNHDKKCPMYKKIKHKESDCYFQTGTYNGPKQLKCFQCEKNWKPKERLQRTTTKNS